MQRCKVCGKKFRNRGEVRSHIVLTHLLGMTEDGKHKKEKLWRAWKNGEIKLSDLHEAVRK